MPPTTNKKPTSEAVRLAGMRRRQLDRDARLDLLTTRDMRVGNASAEIRERASYLLDELDAASRLRMQIVLVERQRDYLQLKIGTVAESLYELGTERLDEPCTNAECPIGCPESHLVDYSAAEDAARAGERIEELLAARRAALKILAMLTRADAFTQLGNLYTDEFRELAAAVRGELSPAEIAELLNDAKGG